MGPYAEQPDCRGVIRYASPDLLEQHGFVDGPAGHGIGAIALGGFRCGLADRNLVEFVELVDRPAIDEFDPMRRVAIDRPEKIALRERPAFARENAAVEAVHSCQHLSTLRWRQLNRGRAQDAPARGSGGVRRTRVDQAEESGLFGGFDSLLEADDFSIIIGLDSGQGDQVRS